LSGVEIAGLAKNSAPGLEVELEKLTKHIMGEK
jgi:hypothetical protein